MEDDGGSSIILHIKSYVKISYLDAIMEEWRIFSKFVEISEVLTLVDLN